METQGIASAQAVTFAKLYKLFRLSKITNNIEKITDNTATLKKVLLSKFQVLKRIIPTAPASKAESDMIMRKTVIVMNSMFDSGTALSDMKTIFKEVYMYMTRSLIIINTAVVGLAGFLDPLVLFPIAIAATFAVFLNAKRHNISYRDAMKNLKLSWKEFLVRQKFTKKEKQFAFFPYFIVSAVIYFIRFPWTDLGRQAIIDKAQNIFSGASNSKSAKVADMKINELYKWVVEKFNNKNVEALVYIFLGATILYLFITVLEQWVLRKGEVGSSEEV